MLFRSSAHDSIGAVEGSNSWYLAEGSTGADDRGSFETYVLVMNPGDKVADVSVTYVTPTGEVEGPRLSLAPLTRWTLNVADTLPGAWHVSTRVESDRPVVAERAMYWSTRDAYRQAAHGSIGAVAGDLAWYLAEGTTMANHPLRLSSGEWPAKTEIFETWILVMNPGERVARVEVDYLTPAGEVEGPRFELGPGCRQTINVADTLPEAPQVSTVVHSDQPVIAERAVYIDVNDGTRNVLRRAAHDCIGVSETVLRGKRSESSGAGGDALGGSIRVEGGERFFLDLPSDPSAGFTWTMAAPLDTSRVRFVSREIKASGEDASRPGSAGTETWTLEAVGEGEVSILLRYARLWEKGVSPVREASYMVSVSR